jgi:hypothetical protein
MRQVVAAAGAVDHAELAGMAEKAFAHLPTSTVTAQQLVDAVRGLNSVFVVSNPRNAALFPAHCISPTQNTMLARAVWVLGVAL